MNEIMQVSAFNLAWLAAVLQPHDVSPHVNFPDDAYDATGPAVLAAMMTGSPVSTPDDARFKLDHANESSLLALVEGCLRSDSIAVAGEILTARLLASPLADPAAGTAMTLVACASLVELERLDDCLELIDAQLSGLSSEGLPDVRLLRAALLQQRALRCRDSDLFEASMSLEVWNMLRDLSPESCSGFLVGPGVSRTSTATTSDMIANLRSAAVSLLSFEDLESAELDGLPTWRDIVKAPAAPVTLRTARERSSEYAGLLNGLFKTKFDDRSRTIGGRAPDLYFSLLWLELLGHQSVYGGRKELAVSRLVLGRDPRETADCIRLLRQARAEKELLLVLNRVRAAGPLDALSTDARQILRSRGAQQLGVAELQVLRTAADLLAPSEAADALRLVQAAVTAGHSPRPFGRWQLSIIWQGVAWMTCAACALVADMSDETGAFLLEQALTSLESDESLDRELRSAVETLDWESVSEAVRDGWLSMLSTGRALPSTAAAIRGALRLPVAPASGATGLLFIAHVLNDALGEIGDLSELPQDTPEVLAAELTRVREAARQGAFGMGGLSAAELVAGLLTMGQAERLWPHLIDFVLDPLVMHEHRSSALRRLASADYLPEDAASRLREAATTLLSDIGPGDFFGSTPVVPFPQALQLLIAHDLLPKSQALEALASLTGSGLSAARRQGAITLNLAARKTHWPEIVPLALPLVLDQDPLVQAHAGVALAEMANSGDSLAELAEARVLALLGSDGIVVTHAILQTLQQTGTHVSRNIRAEATGLFDDHPSFLVRRAAGELLNS